MTIVLMTIVFMTALILAITAFVGTRRIGPPMAILMAGCVISALFTNPRILSDFVDFFAGALFSMGEGAGGDSGPSSSASPSPSPSDKATPKPSAESTASPSETATPEPKAPESTTDWGEVWMWVGLVAACLVVLVVVTWLAVTLWRRSRVKHREYVEAREKAQREQERKEALRKQAKDAWKEISSRHDELDAEYLSYQKELSLVAKYPLMTDLAVPLTKKAVRAMTEARNQKPSLAPEAMEAVDKYREVVTSFELALRAAISNAKREGLKNFSQQEQDDLTQVQDLLRMAEDKAGNPNERRSAYERAVKTLQKILGEVPQEALLEIESRAKEDGIMLAISA